MNKEEQLLKKHKGHLERIAWAYVRRSPKGGFSKQDYYNLACKFLFEIYKKEKAPSLEKVFRYIDTGLKREQRKEIKERPNWLAYDILSSNKRPFKGESEIVADIDRKNAEKKLSDFSRKVNEMMKKGFTASEIAKDEGVSTQYIYKVEKEYIKRLRWLMSTGKRVSF